MPIRNQRPGLMNRIVVLPLAMHVVLMSLSPELALTLIRAACLALIPAQAAHPPFRPCKFSFFYQLIASI